MKPTGESKIYGTSPCDVHKKSCLKNEEIRYILQASISKKFNIRPVQILICSKYLKTEHPLIDL